MALTVRNRVKRAGRPSFYPTGKIPLKDLSRLLGRYTRQDPSVPVMPGIGRDAAVISLSGPYLAVKTDPITFATDQIGSYAVHINANDIAAMGGEPRWFLATLLLPEEKTGPGDVERIFRQIARACRELGIVLCGGHTEITQGLTRPIVVGQMLGEVDKKKLASPDRIRPGDELLLTKGIAIEGTALLAREMKGLGRILGGRRVQTCKDLLRRPGISVVRDSRIARKAAEVHAMHDPTEGGLATGIIELAEAAGLGALVWKEKIFVYPETETLCRELNLDPLGLLASGALLIAAAAEDSPRIISALRRESIRAEVIGQFRAWEKGVKLMEKGKRKNMPTFERDEAARVLEGRRR